MQVRQSEKKSFQVDPNRLEWKQTLSACFFDRKKLQEKMPDGSTTMKSNANWRRIMGQWTLFSQFFAHFSAENSGKLELSAEKVLKNRFP
jgi:hypothetical protein